MTKRRAVFGDVVLYSFLWVWYELLFAVGSVAAIAHRVFALVDFAVSFGHVIGLHRRILFSIHSLVFEP